MEERFAFAAEEEINLLVDKAVVGKHEKINFIHYKRYAHSFPRASLSENCSLLGTDNVRGQISEHIFAPNGGYCLYITGDGTKQMLKNPIHFSISLP